MPDEYSRVEAHNNNKKKGKRGSSVKRSLAKRVGTTVSVWFAARAAEGVDRGEPVKTILLIDCSNSAIAARLEQQVKSDNISGSSNYGWLKSD